MTSNHTHAHAHRHTHTHTHTHMHRHTHAHHVSHTNAHTLHSIFHVRTTTHTQLNFHTPHPNLARTSTLHTPVHPTHQYTPHTSTLHTPVHSTHQCTPPVRLQSPCPAGSLEGNQGHVGISRFKNHESKAFIRRIHRTRGQMFVGTHSVCSVYCVYSVFLCFKGCISDFFRPKHKLSHSSDISSRSTS